MLLPLRSLLKFDRNDRNGNDIINSSNYKSLLDDNSSIQLGSVKSVLKRLRSNRPQQIKRVNDC